METMNRFVQFIRGSTTYPEEKEMAPPSTPVTTTFENAGSLFDVSLLSRVAMGDVPAGLRLRPLHIDDYSKGFLSVLSQLTSVGDVTRAAWEGRFRSMQSRPSQYFVCVVENLDTGRVVGAATLVIEWKFIHEAGSRGRVEDVVVDESMRGKKLGVLLNRVLVELAREMGVYKVSLECKDSLIPFYEQFGYQKDLGNNFLVQRFDNPSKL